MCVVGFLVGVVCVCGWVLVRLGCELAGSVLHDRFWWDVDVRSVSSVD